MIGQPKQKLLHRNYCVCKNGRQRQTHNIIRPQKKKIAIVLLLWRILDNMWLFVSRQLSDSKHWHTVLLPCGSILPFEKQIIWLKKKEDILSN